MVRDRTPVAWRDALKHVLNAPLPVDVVRRYALEFGWDEVIGRQCGVYESMVTSGRPPTESTAS